MVCRGKGKDKGKNWLRSRNERDAQGGKGEKEEEMIKRGGRAYRKGK